MKTMSYTSYTRIGNIIPKHKLILVTGLAGTGKSYSLLKFLNLNHVSPIVMNLDEDPTFLNFDTVGMTSDKNFIQHFFDGDFTDMQDQVVVVDTYIRLLDYVKKLPNDLEFQQQFAEVCLQLVNNYNCTLIIVGHTEAYVTKGTVAFRDNPFLARNCHEHLHFDCFTPTGVKAADPHYRMTVMKGRGIGGVVMHENWLREPVLNPLTNLTC